MVPVKRAGSPNWFVFSSNTGRFNFHDVPPPSVSGNKKGKLDAARACLFESPGLFLTPFAVIKSRN